MWPYSWINCSCPGKDIHFVSKKQNVVLLWQKSLNFSLNQRETHYTVLPTHYIVSSNIRNKEYEYGSRSDNDNVKATCLENEPWHSIFYNKLEAVCLWTELMNRMLRVIKFPGLIQRWVSVYTSLEVTVVLGIRTTHFKGTHYAN